MTSARVSAGLRLSQRITLLTGGGAAALALTILAAANIGAEAVPFGVVLDSLRGQVAEGQQQLAYIFWQLRLPRIALGAVVGFALTFAGGSLQGLLMNPLADPYLIGVSAGAALGASIAIVLNLDGVAGGAGRALLAFAAGAGTMLIVFWLARSRRRVERDAFILAGVVVGSFLWAFVTLVMSLAGQDLQTVVFWLMGNLYGQADWTVVAVAAVLILSGATGLYAYARDLNLIALGEEQARHLGVETEALKRIIILLSALITAAAVSVSGIIGFVGLVIPHIARRLVGPDHRVLLPVAGFLGAIFLVWADTLARAIGETFPVGVLTAILGAPFFFYLLKVRPRPV